VRHVLLGGGGIFGSALRAVLVRRGVTPARLAPPWHDTDAVVAAVHEQLPPVLLDDGPVSVLWAAGVGHVGATPTSLRTETAALEAVCSVVQSLPGERRRAVRVLFASSAGALFAGCGREVVTERSAPQPVSPYGHVKLTQERLLADLVDRTGCSAVICRITNLYGLADGRVTPRGLVSTAVRATRLRQPMTVYVSPDTRRDYVFSNDAAAVALHHVETAPAGLTTTLVRDGATHTVAGVLAIVGSVSGRRVPATYAERPETRLQPPVLRFTPPHQRPDGVRRTPMEAAVHLMLREPLAV
jgi:UDP-glucose 4-epimerase